MHILLPPSETKREGGVTGPVSVSALSFPELRPRRVAVLDALEALLDEGDAIAAAALKLGPRIAPLELARNRALRSSATMPAIERYTGVLFDALGAPSLSPAAQRGAREHIMVHSALFGLVRAGDAIPAYRLSHDAKVPGLRLQSHWADVSTAVLAALRGPIIDLRSDSYAALGPLPDREDAVRVAVVAADSDGAVRALNHFNKKGKGAFVRAVLESGPLPSSLDDLCALSTQLGWPLRRSDDRELELRVPNALQR